MIQLVDIYKKFGDGNANESVLFDRFNFKLEKGDFVSVIGGNGSGKTTLLNIITGTVSADKGKILLECKDITREKEFVRARKIGRVFQDTKSGVAERMTVAENMSLAHNKGSRYGLSKGISKKNLSYYRELLSLAGLGLEDRLNTSVEALSGGQRQSLSLIMATMTPIDLLLLDEHTSALDPKTADQIMALTERLIREKNLTAIMVTHNLRYALEYGNRLCMMKEGRIELDVRGEEKEKMPVSELLRLFDGA